MLDFFERLMRTRNKEDCDQPLATARESYAPPANTAQQVLPVAIPRPKLLIERLEPQPVEAEDCRQLAEKLRRMAEGARPHRSEQLLKAALYWEEKAVEAEAPGRRAMGRRGAR